MFTCAKSVTRRLGHTLAEMLGVVVILAIGAAAVVPSLVQSDRSKVELAASEVAAVLRFAREEARRTGEPTVVVLSGSARLRAFELDVGDPANPALGPALPHPVDRTPYDLDLHGLHFSKGISVSTNLPSGPPGADSAVGFNTRGEPLDASSLTALPERHIDVSFGGKRKRVSIAHLTARVTEAWQ